MANRMKIERKEDLREGDWAKLVMGDGTGKTTFEGPARLGGIGVLYVGGHTYIVRVDDPAATLVEAYREVSLPTEPGVYVAKEDEDDLDVAFLYQLYPGGGWCALHWKSTHLGDAARELAERAHANGGGLVPLAPKGEK